MYLFYYNHEMKKFLVIFLLFITQIIFLQAEIASRRFYNSQIENSFDDVEELNRLLGLERLVFARATTSDERALSLLRISDIFLKLNDPKKAKLIYRQIIQNYSSKEMVATEAKKRLLAL